MRIVRIFLVIGIERNQITECVRVKNTVEVICHHQASVIQTGQD